MAQLDDVSAAENKTPWGGYRLSSAFQPVFSLTHGRLVGHEALLRLTSKDGSQAAPNVVFESLTSAHACAELDMYAIEQHLKAYVEAGKQEFSEWLFLNIHPASLRGGETGIARLERLIVDSQIPPERLVIEVLEAPILEDSAAAAALLRLRQLGCLIALDNFGAGHSNFERVFDLQPHIVKLDRKVLLRAKVDEKARRILQRMVSLIQECGALVLIEGVETLAGAHVALTCDADLVQGYYFGRPAALVASSNQTNDGLEAAWSTFDENRAQADDRWREAMGVHCERLGVAAKSIAAGASLSESCSSFLSSEAASMCYLLDSHGRQLADLVFHDSATQSTGCFEAVRAIAQQRWGPLVETAIFSSCGLVSGQRTAHPSLHDAAGRLDVFHSIHRV